MIQFRFGMPLWLMSIYGGVMIMVVLAIRLTLGRRLPKRMMPVLWALVLVRLLVPFSVSSPLSLPVPSFLEDAGSTWWSEEEATAIYKGPLVAAVSDVTVTSGSGDIDFGFIPKEERIITIEDSAELQIRHIPNLVRLETRAESRDGAKEISMRDLIRASLRMRPDRIIVGEVRGAEAVEMLQAMNTGHDGSISTGHGNSPADMLTRLETMVLMAADLPLAAVKHQIASALDLLIHVSRMRDRSRRVVEISEVTGYEDGEVRLETIYRFTETSAAGAKKVDGALEQVGELKRREKLRERGVSL